MTDPLDIAQWAKHWEALARQAQGNLAGAPSTHYPWQSGAQVNPGWASLFEKPAPFAGAGQQSAAMEHLLAGAQGYLGMLQSMATAAAGQAMGSDGGFAEALRQGALPGAFPTSVMNNPLASAMRDFGGQGAQGLDQMMERFAAMAGPLFDSIKGGLNAPAFGHLREKQENMQNAARLMIDYQEQSARYDRLMLKVSERSFARFQLKLAEREEPGRQIDSIRGLYDLWIDAAEEAYAEIALSEEFREVYGAVVDAQMRLRKHIQGEVEKLCNQFGVPTRSEVDSIGQRLQALRREFREERGMGAGNEELAAELESLRGELADLKSSSRKRAEQQKPARPSKDVKATMPASEKRSVKSAKAGKPEKAPEKPVGTAKATKVEKPAPMDDLPVRKAGVKKSKRKAETKAAGSRRTKRRKKSSGKVAAMAERTSGSKGSADRGSFADSIARFARKSKSSSAATARSRGDQKTAKRGGGK